MMISIDILVPVTSPMRQFVLQITKKGRGVDGGGTSFLVAVVVTRELSPDDDIFGIDYDNKVMSQRTMVISFINQYPTIYDHCYDSEGNLNFWDPIRMEVYPDNYIGDTVVAT